MKKPFMFSFALLISFNCAAINITELGAITKEILEENKLNYAVNLSVNDREAMGFASIRYGSHSNVVSIAVDSKKLRNKSANTWAFIMGHELGHKYLGVGGSAEAEWAADEYGSRWAVNSGYDVAAYIKAMLSDYNSCSQSHGCWHSRAHNLARLHNINIYGSDEEPHKGHKTGHGPFPPSPDAEPSDHNHDGECPQAPAPNHSQQKWVARKVSCTHKVECNHIFKSGCSYFRRHKWHTKHEYDIVYVRSEQQDVR